MKLFLQIFYILIIFFKTGNLLSDNSLFSVNNIKLEKKAKSTNQILADQAIKKGFVQLITKILLKDDIEKLSNLELSTIRNLVTYYQISNISEEISNEKFVNFSVTFDKEKIHDLFYKKGILYSEISEKELYVLPILIKEDEIFVFNNNFFYDSWNEFYKDELIEFILPIENIEIIQNINSKKNFILELDLDMLFKEYTNKNISIVIIESTRSNNNKIFIKSKIQGKIITKSISFDKKNIKSEELNEKIISYLKKELINLIKSENLIDVRTPSFLNAKLSLNKKTNLVELNSRVKNIDLIENIYVQEFNKDQMRIRIKYLGKLDKIINQLKKEKINLQLFNDHWVITIL